MNKLAFILSGTYIDLSPSVCGGLLLEEFACFNAQLAGLTVSVPETAEQSLAENGGIFIRADADIDPLDLEKAIRENRKANVILTGEGQALGYILDAEHAQDIDAAITSKLPKLNLRHSRRITAENYMEIIPGRQEMARERYQKNGVFVESGATVSPLYCIGKGTFIDRGVTLMGSGTIGENVNLVGTCRLTDVTLGSDISVTSSVLIDCKVGSRTTVGPFAYLRPGTEIGEGARIGDFVEIKNSVIADGSKVSHLTYVGDSDVGKGVNFGCGTVTSNYDGQHKYRTVIGDHAFIGCNTNLVAPVTVGNHAYIAAGSTITEDIPDKSLAIARERQTTKENWVEINKPELIK